MSLSLKKTKDAYPIAYYFENKKLNDKKYKFNIKDNKDVDEGFIYYIPNDDTKDDDNEKKIKKIRIIEPDEFFFPIINDFEDSENNTRCYISGPSGCGKTRYIRMYVMFFKKKYPKGKVLLFTSKSEDKYLDDLGIKRIQIDEDILSDPMKIDDLDRYEKPLLCIFDDIEDFKGSTEKKSEMLNNAVASFRDECMRNGRSKGIYLLYVNHNPTEYKKTRNQIHEANECVMFPRQCDQGTYDYFLNKKLFLKKNNIESINELKSNFVMINKGNPKFIISNKYILLP